MQPRRECESSRAETVFQVTKSGEGSYEGSEGFEDCGVVVAVSGSRELDVLVLLGVEAPLGVRCERVGLSSLAGAESVLLYSAQRVCTCERLREERFSRREERVSKQKRQCSMLAIVGWWGCCCWVL